MKDAWSGESCIQVTIAVSVPYVMLHLVPVHCQKREMMAIASFLVRKHQLESYTKIA